MSGQAKTITITVAVTDIRGIPMQKVQQKQQRAPTRTQRRMRDFDGSPLYDNEGTQRTPKKPRRRMYDFDGSLLYDRYEKDKSKPESYEGVDTSTSTSKKKTPQLEFWGPPTIHNNQNESKEKATSGSQRRTHDFDGSPLYDSDEDSEN